MAVGTVAKVVNTPAATAATDVVHCLGFLAQYSKNPVGAGVAVGTGVSLFERLRRAAKSPMKFRLPLGGLGGWLGGGLLEFPETTDLKESVSPSLDAEEDGLLIWSCSGGT